MTSNAQTLDTLPSDSGSGSFARLEYLGCMALIFTAGALQFSIAIAQVCLALAVVCWGVWVVADPARAGVPRFFWPLTVYAAITLVSTAFSPEPSVSLMACKQMVLFAIVPLVYSFATGS